MDSRGGGGCAQVLCSALARPRLLGAGHRSQRPSHLCVPFPLTSPPPPHTADRYMHNTHNTHTPHTQIHAQHMCNTHTPHTDTHTPQVDANTHVHTVTRTQPILAHTCMCVLTHVSTCKARLHPCMYSHICTVIHMRAYTIRVTHTCTHSHIHTFTAHTRTSPHVHSHVLTHHRARLACPQGRARGRCAVRADGSEDALHLGTPCLQMLLFN